MSDRVFNFNVGVLGHVDSGKTSLSKALSTVASTACFDKNPQSKERGITLDLGFSSFSVDVEDEKFGNHRTVQYTLVDCPGHASLIRTIIGGAQIIDLMFLVVDVVKGMQTQTAECLVIGEILCQKMIVVLNKVDLIPAEKRTASVDKMKKRMLKTLESTRFANSPVIAVAARPGGPECTDECEGVTELIKLLLQHTYIPKRNPQGPFVFSVDHCFSIRGQGTVLTGTALSGSASINDTLEMPSMKVTKKIKSAQMFKKPVESVMQGDRAGICVSQFDPKLFERGFVCTPSALPTIEAAIVSVQKIPYFKGAVASKAKFHITIGHDTIMGRVSFFGQYEGSVTSDFDFSKDYVFQEELIGSAKAGASSADGEAAACAETHPVSQFALLELEKPVTCSPTSLVIGSKLDTDIHANMCRLAFHGKVLESFMDNTQLGATLPKLKVYKTKSREGIVERAPDEYSVIGKNLFKKETNVSTFTNLKVTLSSGEAGTIEGGFGQSGKVKIRVPSGLSAETYGRYSGTKKKGKVEEESTGPPVKIVLTFKRYIYDPEKKIRQF